MAQIRYGYTTPAGVPGGLKDLSRYDIVTRLNSEDDGNLRFGLGVVQGESKGNEIQLPDSMSKVEEFEGITMTGFTTEQDMYGNVRIAKDAAVGILNYGKAWVRVADDADCVYGGSVYMVTDGDSKGYLTTEDDDTVTKIKINARWIGSKMGKIAPIELFNSK